MGRDVGFASFIEPNSIWYKIIDQNSICSFLVKLRKCCLLRTFNCNPITLNKCFETAPVIPSQDRQRALLINLLSSRIIENETVERSSHRPKAIFGNFLGFLISFFHYLNYSKIFNARKPYLHTIRDSPATKTRTCSMDIPQSSSQSGDLQNP